MTIPVLEVKVGSRDQFHPLLREQAPELEPTCAAPVKIVDAETGTPLCLVLRMPEELTSMLRQVQRSFPMTTTLRSNGVRNRSSTFGFTSRNAVLRREGCRECNSAYEAPEQHAALVAAAATLAGMLEAELPERAASDRHVASAIRPEWHLAGTQWTSGVLNETSPLPYHYDANNLPTWNAMTVVRRGTRGGRLHFPQLDTVLPCRDGDVVFMPAYNVLHGVTPIKLADPDGYRFTAVYYTVSRMQQCLSPEEETAHARVVRSEREDTLLDRQRASGLLTEQP